MMHREGWEGRKGKAAWPSLVHLGPQPYGADDNWKDLVGAVSRPATYTVTVRGIGIHGFRRWLKAGLGSYGLKVIDAYEHTISKGFSLSYGAGSGNNASAPSGETKDDGHEKI